MSYYSDKIPEKIISQYKESTLLVNFLKHIASEADELKIQTDNIIENRYLLAATGIQLDILGEILGIDREVVDFVSPIYFGLDPDPTGLPLGDLNDPSVGGRFRSADENPVTTRKLIDNEYRALLFAKIAKNTSSITGDEVLQITRNILSVMFIGGDEIDIEINETGNASFELIINAELSGSDQAFIADLDLVPRPIGVRVNYSYIAPPLTLLTNEGLTLFTQDNLALEIQS